MEIHTDTEIDFSESGSSNSSVMFSLYSSEKVRLDDPAYETRLKVSKEPDDILLRAEIELLRNDVETEKQKNEILERQLEEKDRVLKYTQDILAKKKEELREMKVIHIQKDFAKLTTQYKLESHKSDLCGYDSYISQAEEIKQFTKEEQLKSKLDSYKAKLKHVKAKYRSKLRQLEHTARLHYEHYKKKEEDLQKDKSESFAKLNKMISKLQLNMTSNTTLAKSAKFRRSEVKLSLETDKENMPLNL